MSSSRGRQSSRAHARPKKTPGSGRPSDMSSYVGFVVIWLFACFLAYLVEPRYAVVIAAAMLIPLALYVLMCTQHACSGHRLMNWQKSLVRLPLILAGAPRMPVVDIEGTRTGTRARVISMALLAIAIGLTAVAALYV
ncbi:MAG: hypothetical protein ACR2GY_00695 [Phycisphaerales bacterium]